MAPLTKNCDYLVIGGGSGGLASARRASALYGAKVIIVEHNRLGGTCVNVGCVPKKIFWNAATLAESIHEAAAYGFSVKENAPFDWASFKSKRDAYITRLNGIYARNLGNDKVEYLYGHANISGSRSIEVDLHDGGRVSVAAKKILIAVGGTPNVPDIPGAEHGVTSDGFFELERQPKKVAIIGSGYIAVELAGVFNALGTETHLIIRRDRFLRGFDTMIQDALLKEYRRQGIHVHTNSQVSSISKSGETLSLTIDGPEVKSLDTDCLLWAIGRTPVVDNLGLDKIGVTVDAQNHIEVDKYQNTSVEEVYALGDVSNSGHELTPVAIAAGRRLADRLFGGQADSHLDYTNVPSVVFAHPEIGAIGLTEEQAVKEYGREGIKVYTTSFTDMYFSMMEPEDKQGTQYKLICVGTEEKVVGLHIFGRGSAEILQGFGVAIKMGATKKDFDSCVAIHPTAAEEIVTLR